MKLVAQVVMLGLVCAGAAQAGQKCKVVGQWTDTRSGMAIFRTNQAGSALAPGLCAKLYHVTVTDLTQTIFDISATPKEKTCPSFTVALKFKGGCDVAEGKVTVSDGGVYNDTWTKVGTTKVK